MTKFLNIRTDTTLDKFLTTNGTSASWANVKGQTWTYDSTTETLTIT